MNKIKGELKEIIVGRKTSLIDNAIFKISGGRSSGWKIGNQIRSFLYGSKKKISKEPIIILGGYPRSGTSLMQLILGQHPDVISPQQEIHLFQDIKERKMLKEELSLSKKERNELKEEKDLIKIIEEILEIYKKRNNAKIVLLKQPKHIFLAKEILKYFPHAKFINMIRDGRDATMSQRKYCLYPGVKEWPFDWCCRQWVTCVRIAEKFSKDKRFLTIKYEDLVNNPKEELRKILKFSGLKKVQLDSLLEFNKNINKNRYKTHPGLRKKIYNKAVGKGLKKMNRKDKETFKKIAGKDLIKLGYVKDNNW